VFQGAHLAASEQLATIERDVVNLRGDERCLEIYIFVMGIEQFEIASLLKITYGSIINALDSMQELSPS
jgi:hypothetical protein